MNNALDKHSNSNRTVGSIHRIPAATRMQMPHPTRVPDTGSFDVFFVVAGAMTLTSANGKRLTLRSGDLLLSPVTESITASTTAESHACVLQLPRWAAQPHHAVLSSASGRPWSTNSGAASIVAHVLRAWSEQSASYAPHQPGRLTTHVAGLLAMMFTEQATERASLLDQAKDHIEQNLANIELTPESIASAINVSTRTLHRLFTVEQESVGNWTRNRRLESCRLDLADPRYANDSISTIGARWGIPDASQLSRSFKARFNETPRELRARVARATVAALPALSVA